MDARTDTITGADMPDEPAPDQRERIRLSHLSHGAGWACKLGRGELTQVLRHILPVDDPDVLVDQATSDDAAVYRLDPERALIATTDFFTPIVDDPYDFGRIAAANALSDIYAMGGRPLFALNLVAFPRRLLDEPVLGEILRGGADAAREAGLLILGGHSLDDPEPKYGLCVIGEVHPERIVRNSTARAGDRLVLTKPIGTGIISTAAKADAASPETVAAAVTSMATLNRGAAEAMSRVGVSAATDVTGFGLLGHLSEMMEGSGTAARIRASSIPMLPDALALAAAGHVPGGTRRNLEDVGPFVAFDEGLDEAARLVLADAQTSGGLLISLPGDRVDALVAALGEADAPAAAVIGEVIEEGGTKAEEGDASAAGGAEVEGGAGADGTRIFVEP